MSRLNIQTFQHTTPALASTAFVHQSATIIGNVQLDNHVSVWPGAVIRGDINSIHIGEGSNIQDCAVLHVNHKTHTDPLGSPIVIGKYVTIGHTVVLHGCEIADECLVGMGSIVMDKVVLQKHVLLAAGSLVPEGKVLESGYLYVGRPAKKLRPLTADEIAFFMVSANGYIALKDEYLSA